MNNFGDDAMIDAVVAILIFLVGLLFGERLRYRLNKPSVMLSLRVNKNSNKCYNYQSNCASPKADEKTVFCNDRGDIEAIENSVWYHLDVSNTGHDVARNVEIFVTGLKRLENDDFWSENEMHGPIKLRWQYDDRHRAPTVVNLGPDRVCDLLYVTRHHLRLATYLRPNWLEDTIKSNQQKKQGLKIEIKVFSENTKTHPYYIKVLWDSIYVDPYKINNEERKELEIMNHLKIMQIDKGEFESTN